MRVEGSSPPLPIFFWPVAMSTLSLTKGGNLGVYLFFYSFLQDFFIIIIIVALPALSILLPPQEKRISLLACLPTCRRLAVRLLLRSPCLVHPNPSGACTFQAQDATSGLADVAS